MGTRGAMGVRIDGVDKIEYNHFDSYPEGLGKSVVETVRAILQDRTLGVEGLCTLARRLRAVDPSSEPTDDDIEALRGYANLDVSDKSLKDWYCLTYGLRRNLLAKLRLGVVIDSHDFLSNSLFCEWAYVVNLDELTFEVYRGFQKQEHDKGRYAKMDRDPDEVARQRSRGFEYWPVALIATFPLLDIPQDWAARVRTADEE